MSYFLTHFVPFITNSGIFRIREKNTRVIEKWKKRTETG